MEFVRPPWWRRALAGPLVVLLALSLAVPIALIGWVLLQAHDAREGLRTQLDDLSLDTLQPGDCANEIGDGEDLTLRQVPCAKPHDGEITGVVSLTAGAYPGKERVIDESDVLCASATDSWVLDGPGAEMDLELGFFYPSQQGWAANHPTSICYAVARSREKIRGPLEAIR